MTCGYAKQPSTHIFDINHFEGKHLLWFLSPLKDSSRYNILIFLHSTNVGHIPNSTKKIKMRTREQWGLIRDASWIGGPTFFSGVEGSAPAPRGRQWKRAKTHSGISSNTKRVKRRGPSFCRLVSDFNPYRWLLFLNGWVFRWGWKWECKDPCLWWLPGGVGHLSEDRTHKQWTLLALTNVEFNVSHATPYSVANNLQTQREMDPNLKFWYLWVCTWRFNQQQIKGRCTYHSQSHSAIPMQMQLGKPFLIHMGRSHSYKFQSLVLRLIWSSFTHMGLYVYCISRTKWVGFTISTHYCSNKNATNTYYLIWIIQ